MTILLCDDGRLISGKNKNETLARRLAERGHDTIVVDGRDTDGKELLPAECAELIATRLGGRKVDGIVMDLHWFKDPKYGIALLDELDQLLTLDCKIVVYSHHADVNVDRIELKTRRISSDRILSRNFVDIRDVASEF